MPCRPFHPYDSPLIKAPETAVTAVLHLLRSCEKSFVDCYSSRAVGAVFSYTNFVMLCQ